MRVEVKTSPNVRPGYPEISKDGLTVTFNDQVTFNQISSFIMDWNARERRFHEVKLCMRYPNGSAY